MPKVTLIPGDGIGPEITAVMQNILKLVGADIEWEVIQAGGEEAKRNQGALSSNLLESIEKTRIAIKGPITTPIGKGFRSMNVELRKKYDLYANIRPILSMGKIPSRYSKVDLVIFRENTEDLYAGKEVMVSEDEAHSIKVITRQASKRIALAAYTYALKHQRKKVAIVQKANIMKLSDGLFLDVCREVALQYPQIQTQEILVDNMCMQLVVDPSRYDVILTENLYGDILSDLCAGLVGGLGFVPGANIGQDMAIFESVHGSAPDIAGQGIANPTAMLLTACMMLDYLKQDQKADLIRQSLAQLFEDPNNFTKDIQGPLNTAAFEAALRDIIIHRKGEQHAQ